MIFVRVRLAYAVSTAYGCRYRLSHLVAVPRPCPLAVTNPQLSPAIIVVGEVATNRIVLTNTLFHDDIAAATFFIADFVRVLNRIEKVT